MTRKTTTASAPAGDALDIDAALAPLRSRRDELLAEATRLGETADTDRLEALEAEALALLQRRNNAGRPIIDPETNAYVTWGPAEASRLTAVEAERRTVFEAQRPELVSPLLVRAREDVEAPARRLMVAAMLRILTATVAADLPGATGGAGVLALFPDDALPYFLEGALHGGRRTHAALAMLALLHQRTQGVDGRVRAELFAAPELRAAVAFFLGETPLRWLDELMTTQDAVREASRLAERRGELTDFIGHPALNQRAQAYAIPA